MHDLSPSPSGWTLPHVLKYPKILAQTSGRVGGGLSCRCSEIRPRSLDPPGRVIIGFTATTIFLPDDY